MITWDEARRVAVTIRREVRLPAVAIQRPLWLQYRQCARTVMHVFTVVDVAGHESGRGRDRRHTHVIARLADPVHKTVVAHRCPTTEPIICEGATPRVMLRTQRSHGQQWQLTVTIASMTVIARVLKFTAARGPLNAMLRSTVASAESAWK